MTVLGAGAGGGGAGAGIGSGSGGALRTGSGAGVGGGGGLTVFGRAFGLDPLLRRTGAWTAASAGCVRCRSASVARRRRTMCPAARPIANANATNRASAAKVGPPLVSIGATGSSPDGCSPTAFAVGVGAGSVVVPCPSPSGSSGYASHSCSGLGVS